MVVTGIILFGVDSGNRLGFFTLFYSAIGIFETYRWNYKKKRWVKDRLAGRSSENVKIEFDDSVFKVQGALSKGEINWMGFKEIRATKTGILLKPQNGISIYLPYSCFGMQDQIDFVLSKKPTSVE